MTETDRRFLKACAAGFIGVMTLSVLLREGLSAQGITLTFNPTASAPIGLWAIATRSRAFHPGDYVVACPPPVAVVESVLKAGGLPEGSCPSGTGPVLKTIGAVASDTVTLREGFPVSVNGSEMQGMIPGDSFPAWPSGTYPVGPSEVWLLSDYHPRSFDSRYFGPVQVDQVIGKAYPVFALEDVKAPDETTGDSR